MKRIITTLIVCISGLLASAQQTCLSKLDVGRAKAIASVLSLNNKKIYSGTRPMVRWAIHRITRTNGTGGFTWAEIHQ